MIVGSGPQSPELFVKYDPDLSSWKTCHQLFEQVYPLSSQTLPGSGSMRSGACYPRPKLEPLIGGNDSGSWPTPTAFDANTPANISLEARERQLRRGNPDGTRRSSSGSLAKEIHWPTPQAADGHKIGSMTPETAIRQAAAGHQEMLMGAAVLWPTPQAHDSQPPRSIENMAKRNSPDLTDMAIHLWPTPKAHDGKAGAGDQPEARASADLPTSTTIWANTDSLHTETPPTGTNGSPRADLNPSFVASLMGLPPGWLMLSTSEVMVSSRNALQKQSDNSSTEPGGI